MRALRFGSFYASLFLVTGACMPFMPLWFADRGLSGSQVGLLFSLPILARTVTGPLLGLWADGLVLRRSGMVLIALGAVVAFVLMLMSGGLAPALGFWIWLALWLISQSFITALVPQMDMLALDQSRALGFSFGLARAVGSAGFVVANLLVGQVVALTGSTSVLIWAIAASLLTAAVARYLLPPVKNDPVGQQAGLAGRWSGALGVLKDGRFMLGLGAAGLIQSTHAFYYAFSTLIWREQGIGEDWMGLLWAVGVVAEIVFLIIIERWRERLSPVHLIGIGGLAALGRWTVMAFQPHPFVLVPLQVLHALSFAAVYIGSLTLVMRLAPRESGSSGQMINAALGGGLLMGLATLVSGPLYDQFAASGYLAMSLMALVGLIGLARFASLPVPSSGPC